MKLPKFYYKAENTSGNNWKIKFSNKEVDLTWKCWEGNNLIGAFEAIYTSYKLRSIKSSSESSGDISWTTFREYARNTYGENHGKIVTWEQHCMMAFLFYAYYCNTNPQALCGSGYNSHNKPCGQQLSMIDTNSSNGNTEAGINFWGLENWWGDKAEFVDNVSGGSNVFTITTYDGATGAWGANRTTTAYNVIEFFAHMTVGEYLDASALDSTSASDSTGYCDWFQNNGSSGILVRSGGYSSSNVGITYAVAVNSPSYAYSPIGSRLSYVGPWTLLTTNEYIKQTQKGVFIQDINGNLYKTSEWNRTKKANGIAVITDKVRLLLELTEATAQISNSTNDPLENYATEIYNESVAKNDYNGKMNTANIIRLTSSTAYAAGRCNSFTFPDGKTTGYLPALGELCEIYQNKSAVNAALSACGGTEMNTDYNSGYWSSTFYGSDGYGNRFCWKMVWPSGKVSSLSIEGNICVRAVASLD